MTNPTRKEHIRATFDTVADGYDCAALRFFAASAQAHAECFRLHGHEHLLDMATGTGAVALALAERLPAGRVTGIDFSPAMLARARTKAQALQVTNVLFREMDMQAPEWPAASFDGAACGFGLFFVDDMVQHLRTLTPLLKPGGQWVVSGFTETAFQPLIDLFLARLRAYGRGTEVTMPWKRMATERQCAELYRQAGLRQIRVTQKNLGYHLRDAREWWDFVWYAGLRGLLASFDPDELASFKKEHLAEIQAQATGRGVWLDVQVLYTHGVNPV